jgi:hypothetical protein
VLASASPYKDVLVTAVVERFPARVARKLWLTLFAFVALGVALTVLNLRMPVARNSLEYAKAALEISNHHFNLLAVVHDRALSSGKPIVFGLLAAPFVRPFGAGVATLVASSLGTVFFLWMVVVTLGRLNRRSGLEPTIEPLELALVAFNPLVLYQFWSAYPDSLFAGLALLAFNLTDQIAVGPQRDTRWQVLALGATIDVAIHTKLFGAVLLRRSIAAAAHDRECELASECPDCRRRAAALSQPCADPRRGVRPGCLATW